MSDGGSSGISDRVASVTALTADGAASMRQEAEDRRLARHAPRGKRKFVVTPEVLEAAERILRGQSLRKITREMGLSDHCLLDKERGWRSNKAFERLLDKLSNARLSDAKRRLKSESGRVVKSILADLGSESATERHLARDDYRKFLTAGEGGGGGGVKLGIFADATGGGKITMNWNGAPAEEDGSGEIEDGDFEEIESEELGSFSDKCEGVEDAV